MVGRVLALATTVILIAGCGSAASTSQSPVAASPADSASQSPVVASPAASASQSASIPASVAPAASLDASAIASELIDPNKLIVGESADPPFVIRTADGTWDSLAVILVQKFATYIGKQVSYETTGFTTGVAGLQARKFDMLGSDWHATAARKAVVNFSTPFNVSGTSYWVLKSSGITTLDQLNDPNVSIAVVTGTDNQTATEANLPKAHEVLLPNAFIGDLILQLQSKRVTAISNSSYLGPALVLQYPDFVTVPNNDTGVASLGAGWAFNMNSPALLQAANAFMAMEIQSGDLAALTKQYMVKFALAPTQ
jgi:ABC-type amino acid transport substrate-binding protein